MSARNIVRSIGISVFCIAGISLAPTLVYEFEYAVPDFIEPIISAPLPPPTVFFVGDVMLGRNVEKLMEQNGHMYPFKNVENMLASYDITVGNFEGIVSEQHIQAPSMTFQFSIKKEYLRQLHSVGFDILSLANNHSFDYGASALSYTRAQCPRYTLICAGSPTGLDEYSIVIKKVGTKKVGFIFIYAVFSKPDTKRLIELLEVLTAETDAQIAYIHWGDEYMLTHNDSQEKLATTLIEQGVDAVIGHHPHVVQDVALYKGKPIFYSLGNFVFDQYFDENVQEGLGVAMTLHDSSTEYKLVSFTSKGTYSQPREMAPEEFHVLMTRILEGVKNETGVYRAEGRIVVENN